MSLSNTKWLYKEIQNSGDPLLDIIQARGIKDKQSFLTPDRDALIDPYKMKGLGLAVDRIHKAIKDRESIRVVTDYDVDGTTSSLILQATLNLMGGQGVSYHIPDRMTEGYGFSVHAAEKAAKDGCHLIVTADIGVKDTAAVTRARELGVDVVILDHHLPPGDDVPQDANVVLCPPQVSCSYPNQALAACGVSFKLAQAMIAKHPHRDSLQRSLLKLAAIGTVADVVSLMTEENRAIVHLGLEALNQDNHGPGLSALLKVSGVIKGQIDSTSIGFRIGPRINAAGRLESATRIIDLLTNPSTEDADRLAAELDNINTERRGVQEAMLEYAYSTVSEPPPPFILVAQKEGPKWHRGVAGIVAARLRDKYNRPSAVVAITPQGATGSARSIPQVHAVKALDFASSALNRYGGHPAAAGFSLDPDKIPILERLLGIAVEKQLAGDSPAIEHPVDIRMPLKDISSDTYYDILPLEPHGKGNPKPLFWITDCEVSNTRILKGKHLKGTLNVPGYKRGLDFIWWGAAPYKKEVSGSNVEVLGTLGMNVWRGAEKLQIVVEDMKFS